MSIQDKIVKGINYLSGIAGAVLSPKVDGFVDLSNNLPNMVVSSGALASMTLVGGLITLLIAFASAVGAARMSWCYNSYLGTSENMKIIYAVLAFGFFGIYYPYYGLFLDPACLVRRNK